MKKCLVITLILTGFTTAVQATPVLYDNEINFLNSLIEPTLESFEENSTTLRDTNPIITPNFTMTISAISSGNLNWRVTDESRPTAGVFPTDGTIFVEAGAGLASNGAAFVITFAFLNPIESFGLSIVDFGDVGTSGEFSISNDNGDLFLIAENPPAWNNGNQIFFGLIDEENPFSSIVLTKSTMTDGIGIDEIYFTNAPVSIPEPGTGFLASLGIFVIISLRLCKKVPLTKLLIRLVSRPAQFRTNVGRRVIGVY